MEKYRLKNKPSQSSPETEIRVNSKTQKVRYLTYVASLFEKGKDTVCIKGAGYAIPTAVSLSNLLRHRFAGLHQIVEIGTVDIEDEYEPLEEGTGQGGAQAKSASGDSHT